MNAFNVVPPEVQRHRYPEHCGEKVGTDRVADMHQSGNLV
jgi:hypothetical protein